MRFLDRLGKHSSVYVHILFIFNQIRKLNISISQSLDEFDSIGMFIQEKNEIQMEGMKCETNKPRYKNTMMLLSNHLFENQNYIGFETIELLIVGFKHQNVLKKNVVRPQIHRIRSIIFIGPNI